MDPIQSKEKESNEWRRTVSFILDEPITTALNPLTNLVKDEESNEWKKTVSFKLDEPITMALNPLTNVVKDEDSLSFVVLGKDSVEAQASLLASYVDIQQKSMSIDYKSMVSSMTMTEMQHRLTELLQENVKLKETLRQNNESMKQQFNTLAMWQEEVTKIHQSHKQKFVETKKLINYLKKENTELRTKFWLSHFEDEATSEVNTINAFIKQEELEHDISKLTDVIPTMAIEKYKDCITSVKSQKFADGELQQKLQQSKTEKELESAMIDEYAPKIYPMFHGNVEEAKKSLKCLEACSAKDQEIICLKEYIALLEQKLQCVLTPVKQDLSEPSNLSRQKFVQNMKQYNDMLQELSKCFVKQVGRFAAIEKSLKEITDILRLDDDNLKIQCKEKLSQFCKQLSDEQIKIITDRQILIKSQDQFQKIFSDYNSILYELEITIDENAKLNVLRDNSARENLQTSEQLERDKHSLEEEKKVFDQEKENLENEKKSFESQKKSLDTERISLQDEKKLLEQEKISLNEEKTSLDHQSQLYENCERDLYNEKKVLQVHNEQLLGEISSLRHQIDETNARFQNITEQFVQSTEEIQLLRSQLLLYEEDFQQEKNLKEALLEEKNKLDTELLKQIEFNKQLQSSNNSKVESAQTSEHSKAALTACPKCADRFRSLPELMRHIETCVD